MAVYKEGSTWRAVYRYTDWQGQRRQTQKRGFPTKREALAWEREQLNKKKADLNMTFSSFEKPPQREHMVYQGTHSEDEDPAVFWKSEDQ